MSRIRFLIPLPQGPVVSGVTTWAVRLANALADEHDDIQAELLVHQPRPDQTAIPLRMRSRVIRHDLVAPPLWESDSPTDRVDTTLDAWRSIARELSVPLILAPGVHHDAWTVALRMRHEWGGAAPLRLFGWLHRDDPYDFAMLEHATPFIDRFIALTTNATTRLATRIGERTDDLVTLPYAVPVPRSVPARPPLGSRPIELLYVGRLDADQKRLADLFAIARGLRDRSIPFRLRLVGAGPAERLVDEQIHALERTGDRHITVVERIAACEPDALPKFYDSADALLLTSRVEGLPVTMLEAMAHGVIPLVTAVGGAPEVIDDGRNGRLFEVGDVDGFVDAIASWRALDHDSIEHLRERARATIETNHDLQNYAARVAEMIRSSVRDDPQRSWPMVRPFALPPSGVTAERCEIARQRLRRLLDSFDGEPVAIWGAGRHTVALVERLVSYSGPIIVLDDDPRRHEERLLDRWPILPPSRASLDRHGVREVIISSAFYESLLYARRGELGIGVRVHRLHEEMSNDAMREQAPIMRRATTAGGPAPRVASG